MGQAMGVYELLVVKHEEVIYGTLWWFNCGGLVMVVHGGLVMVIHLW